jgi:hypothetical protein
MTACHEVKLILNEEACFMHLGYAMAIKTTNE